MSGTTAGTVTHGGPSTPDLVQLTQVTNDRVASGWANTARSATTITLDFEDDGVKYRVRKLDPEGNNYGDVFNFKLPLRVAH